MPPATLPNGPSQLDDASSQGQTIDASNGLTLVLKKNGKVGTRRLGTPPWEALVADVENRRNAGMDVENI